MKKLILTFTLLAASAAFGQGVWGNNNGQYGNQYPNSNSSTWNNAAQDNGYRDGFARGQQDRMNNSRANANTDDYRRGDRGYSQGAGSRGQYKQAYRAAYQQGYSDGFSGNAQNNGVYRRGRRNGESGRDRDRDHDGDRDRNGTYGNNGVYRNGTYGNNGVYGNGNYGSQTANVASRMGFQDGVWYAQQDMAKGRQQNPENAKGYKDADHGYTSSYNRDEFKQYYRQAFIQGYQQTFSRARY